MRIVFKNFRIIDEARELFGALVVDNGLIQDIIDTGNIPDGDIVIDGRAFGESAVLMPAFIDLHSHFREPGFPEKEVSPLKEALESASLAAAAGGFATVVCMANTKPVIDTLDKALALKARSNALGLIDLYPVLSLTKNMEGRELSGIKDISRIDEKNGQKTGLRLPLMLSEDGKDVADNALFLAAMKEAKRLGIPVSCHCDFGGPEAQAAKSAGRERAEWSRMEENFAVRRTIELGKSTGCHIHIAHVSTKEATEIIRDAKKSLAGDNGFSLTCEAAPHHIGATEEDARRMGDETCGRVNPPLRSEADRHALIAAIRDKTIDAVATDHAPHSDSDKAAGMPGFTGLETAFAVSLSNLTPDIGLRRLSALMSANPARVLGLEDRGRVEKGLRADLVIADTGAQWKVQTEKFKSRGKCSPFAGKELRGNILMTLNAGRIVFTGGGIV
ncbi:MAG: dihydroorotase [Treponema sp.]|jgi:dihydroorotase|nr:dihydroorotase [Treponema sp.]